MVNKYTYKKLFKILKNIRTDCFNEHTLLYLTTLELIIYNYEPIKFTISLNVKSICQIKKNHAEAISNQECSTWLTKYLN